MSSLVEEFVVSPSEDLLEKLTKDQLCEIVHHYELIITSQEKKLKETLVIAVKNQLFEKGVFGDFSTSSEETSEIEKGRAAGEIKIQKEIEFRKLEQQFELKQLENEDRERVHERERDESAFALRKLEIEITARRDESLKLEESPTNGEPSESLIPSRWRDFDIAKNIRLVPPYSEKDVDRYFAHFERVATTLQWPKEVWPLMLQCVFTGKAQEVFVALSDEQARQYDVVKRVILHAYELVPEAYRQRFRNARKWESL